MVSDRELDAYDNPAKSRSRMNNLHFVRAATYRLWSDGSRKRLRCDWCELMGRTGHLTRQLLLRERVIDPSQFIGIDLSEDHAQKHGQDGVVVLSGDLLTLVEDPALARVGVPGL